MGFVFRVLGFWVLGFRVQGLVGCQRQRSRWQRKGKLKWALELYRGFIGIIV